MSPGSVGSGVVQTGKVVAKNSTKLAKIAKSAWKSVFGETKLIKGAGKGIVEGYKPALKHSTTTESKIPTRSEPNSSIDRVDGNGNVVSRRYFDENGLAKKDVDFTDHGYPKDHPEVPHEHDWDWNNSDKPSRSK
jgi:hypothetical protein